MFDATALPEPSADALAVSAALGEVIGRAIRDAGGSLGFDDFMRMALYEPGLGYYVGGAIKFGASGDFVTAPELSPLFGMCVARAACSVLEHTNGSILEFGAGSGALAASVLRALSHEGRLPGSYTILELSPDLRERQRESIERQVPEALDRVTWIAALPPDPIDGLVLANEIIDALPVRVFRIVDGSLAERRVRATPDGFDWIDEPADPAFEACVRARLDPALFESGNVYTSEFNIGISPWISDLARVLRRGAALIVDYGYPRSEYYHPSRSSGTLQCHYRHRVHDDPFRFPGLQDITASVDFTEVAEAADANGLHVAGFTGQGNFLIETGLLEHVETLAAGADETVRQRLAYETKVLSLPTEMGTRFRFLALSRDLPGPPAGFERRDERHRL